jgi:hypothetical protein
MTSVGTKGRRPGRRVAVRFAIALGGVVSVFGVLYIWLVAAAAEFCVGPGIGFTCPSLNPPAYHVIPLSAVIVVAITSAIALTPLAKDQLWFVGNVGSAATVAAYLYFSWTQLQAFPVVSVGLFYGGIVLFCGAAVTFAFSVALGRTWRRVGAWPAATPTVPSP